MTQPGIASFFKSKRKLEDNALLPNSKSKKSENLNDEKRGQLTQLNISSAWEDCLLSEVGKPYMEKLLEFVDKERKQKTVFPSHDDVFSWTRYCKFKDIKVVILGQDPYHGPNQAHGLCFSVNVCIPPPPSLKNIFKALKNDYSDFTVPSHGYLVGWARQGVLMINAVLTVERAKANSHKSKGWEKLTDHVIKSVSDQLTNCVFLLWGAPAIKKKALISSSKHHILTAAHPSPLSAYRGFFECQHFLKANEYLASHDIPEIDWTDLPTS